MNIRDKIIVDAPTKELQEAIEDKIDLELAQRYSIDHVIAQIALWGRDRKITTNGVPITQAIKTLEECHELLEAVNTNNTDEIIDAIGDIVVTLVMQCELQGLDLHSCITSAYNEIKDRKGYLNEVGDFIKEK